jgi:hypothetical protein
VLSVPKLGGPVTTVAAQVASPTSLAAYGGVVYWIGKDGLFMVTAGGGPPHLIATNGEQYGGRVAADATGLVWTTDDTMMRADLNGSSASLLAPDAPVATAIAIDKANAFLMTGLTVFSASREGGASATFELGCGYADKLAIDDGAVYYGCGDDLTLRRMPRAGGTPTTLVSQVNISGFIGGIALDATSLFFTNNGRVLKASKTTPGTPSVLAGDQAVATAIGVDETSVYWLSLPRDGGLGAVMCVNAK